ncbi:MAG: hypothetical protein V3U92_13375 [Cellulophaga sp.]
MKKIIFLVIIIGITFSCKNLKTLNKQMYNSVPKEFNTIKMKIKGVDGWMPGSNIKYGGYRALKIKRGSTKRTGLSLFPNIYTNKNLHKITSFTQIATNGDKANIYIVQKYSKKGINININRNIEIDNSTVNENSFIGKILMDSNDNWSFVINSGSSIAKNINGEKIVIEHNNYGYDFIINNKKVAGYAVGVFIKNWSPLANYAWINPNITDEKKLVLASLITALIGRENINISENDD